MGDSTVPQSKMVSSGHIIYTLSCWEFLVNRLSVIIKPHCTSHVSMHKMSCCLNVPCSGTSLDELMVQYKTSPIRDIIYSLIQIEPLKTGIL